MHFFYRYLIIVLMFSCFESFAQNETNYWYFGENAGINFSNGEVSVLTDSNMVTPAGCSSISDANGNLLFYTNGNTIWNKNHQVMVNGNDLAGDIEGVQTSIIIPKPNDDSTYYVFYTRENNGSNPLILRGIYYSEVKFTTSNPNGIVTIKNDIISNTTTSRLSAIYNYQTNSYRLICLTKDGQNSNQFKVFNISSTGFNVSDINSPVVWPINEDLESFGAMKISPDGKNLAVADNTLQKVIFYKFDNDNINFQFNFVLPTVPAFALFVSPYGIEFSQDSKMFYYAGGNHIVQFAFLEFGIAELSEYYLINEPNVYSMQLARNGKIYITKGDLDNPSKTISVINNPEELGINCEFQSDAINLSSGNATKGLPNFVSNFLRNRIISSEDDCVNTNFNFSLDTYLPITSVQWDFNDGTFSSELEPIHLFTTPGIKKVKAIVTFGSQTVALYENIEVYPLPNLQSNVILTQCDDNNDGYSIFNLENIKDFLEYSNVDFKYIFYNNQNDALNNTNPIQNHLNYTNTSILEEIFVKIISDKGCSISTSFFIESVQTNIPFIPTIYVCENSDNINNDFKGVFDLGIKKQDIINQLGLTSNYSISFYDDLLDAQTKLNKLDRYFTSTTTTIWIRIEDENFNCFGIVPFNAVVNSQIDFEIDDVYTICENDDSPITLDGGSNNNAWSWKNRVGSILLSNNRFFEISQIGFYTLTVTKEENGIVCSQSKDFRVVKSDVPILKQIVADDGRIFVSVVGIGNYTYSIDGIYYYGSGTSHTFTNLEYGTYTVFIKDISGCKTILVSNINLFNFPKFFTPNGDGINDYWKIYGKFIGYYSNLEIDIFDRYGRLLHTMNLKQNQFGWDGVFNKEKLPASDYWYKMTLTDLNNNVIYKNGHFSLIR